MQCPRSFETEEAAADDRAADGTGATGRLVLHPSEQRGDVVDGPVHEHAREVRPDDRRHRGTGPGCEHELVVAPHPPVLGPDGPGGAVELDRRRSPREGDTRVRPGLGRAQGEALGLAPREVGRQSDAVVGRAGFLGEDGHVPAIGRVTVEHRLDEPLGDHPAADHDELLGD